MRFELHCHSTCSDGTEPPERVAERAAERGVHVFALTDHDTCAGRAHVAGARNLRAVELTCDADGKTIHVLAYDRGGEWSAIDDKLAAVRTARKNRLRVMAAKLAQRGIHIDVEPMLADADRRAVGRPDLARAMVAAGAATSPRDAFARHLYDGGPVDVPNRALSLADALAAGRAANAAMALAHPHLYEQLGVSLLRRHKPDGLTGIEAFYGVYDLASRRRWIDVADELGLVCTGGSDWHGPEKAGTMNSTGTEVGVDLPDRRADALLAWLGA
jgi:predicted metal-dependent phosphoesterase TrpH